MSTFHGESNSHGTFDFNAQLGSSPSQTTQAPRMASKLAARGYPPNTYTLPPSPDLYPGCNGKPGPMGHVKKCKVRPTISPDPYSKTKKKTSATSTLAIKTVWVDQPMATHAKRHIEDANADEVSKQDVKRLPAEIKAYTTQGMPSFAEEQQQVLAKESASEPSPTSNLWPHMVGNLTLQEQLSLEQFIRARIADIDYETKLDNIFWAAFFGIMSCLVMAFVLLLFGPSEENLEEMMEAGRGGEGEKYGDEAEDIEDEDEGKTMSTEEWRKMIEDLC